MCDYGKSVGTSAIQGLAFLLVWDNGQAIRVGFFAKVYTKGFEDRLYPCPHEEHV